MAMSKKDFEAMAEAIAYAKDAHGVTTPEEMRKHLGEQIMNACRAQYTGGYGFDTGRFRRAADIES